MKRLLSLTRPYWKYYGALFFLSFLSAPLALLAPLPLSLVADFVVGSRPVEGSWLAQLPFSIGTSPETLLLIALFIMIFTTLLQQLDSYGNWLLQTYLGEKVSIDIKQFFFQHILHLPLQKYRDIHSADYLYRLQTDIPAVTYIPIQWIIMASSTVTVGGMLYVMARLDLRLALLAIGVLPFVYIFLKVYEPKARLGWNDYKEMETHFLAFLKEALGAVLLIKGYGMERTKAEELGKIGRKVLAKNMKAILIESLFGGLIALILALGAGLVLYVGTHAVLRGTLSLGHLILVMGYLIQLYKPLETLAKKTANLQSAMVSAQRIFAILDLKPDPLYLTGVTEKQAFQGEIELQDLHFRYADRLPTLDGLNLRIPAGNFIGISGSSGVGKSTLLQILLGLIKPDRGLVYFDGRPLPEIGAESLRQLISVVFQDTVLFSGTIRDNIAFGMQNVSRDEVEKAAQDAHAHDFIMQLPKGYDTHIGESGLRLSGGERQRIALARAFLRNRPILILDEPTSAVDQSSEKLIIDALQKLVQNRTTILVSHRLESFKNCQQRYELVGGKLVALGA
ncbi:ABC transporter ATP-binding protein [Oligoflexus tunisiensis]|uniref:ABC transporter ATP-binding protein n=1 Tax=Oligoflexus tunisiensis TaxID=708132 RepID=UPI00159F1EF3|nr:ABC transporter ATP-binding protein [Oligoflexus tunisiensis]